MFRLLLRSPTYYWTLVENRILRPFAWHLWIRRKVSALTDEDIARLCNSNRTSGQFADFFHDNVRFRFFFHPRNQKDFFLNLLTRTQAEESILSEADDVLDNRFDTLGSGKISLGSKINWHGDFKSGKVWELKSPWRLDLMDMKNPSDVKVPWELSRFHQVWWLGKAYWLTRNEKYAAKFAELIDDWIVSNPVGLGVNWAVGMETAIRAMNWIAGYYFFCDSNSIPDEFWLRFIKSLYVHGVHIRNHLEYTWRNENHIISDFVGLVALGILFRDTAFGKSWLRWGIRNLEREMASQVSADGVDYEKSTSYQRLVAELFYTTAILCTRNGVELTPSFMNRLEKMFEFIQYYVRPDGSIPLFGDADDGRLFRFIADTDINDHRHALSVGAILFNRGDFKHAAGAFHQDALWLFGAEGFERYQMIKAEGKEPDSRAFPQGGFFVMRNENVHVMVDAGDIGTGGMGGHGHNDTLSFEYWVNGESLIIDSGTYAYTSDVRARQEFRSGRSHNTILVDNKEIARFVGLWLILSDRTRPRVIEWTNSSERDILEAAQYAYQSVVTTAVHRRRIVLDKLSQRLEITDTLEGRGKHHIESFLHFSPAVTVETLNSGNAVALAHDARYSITNSVGQFRAAQTWFSPSYGVRQKNQSLILELSTDLPQEIITTISAL